MAQLKINVLYADEFRQEIVHVWMNEGTSAFAAARASGLLPGNPPAPPSHCNLGIFGRSVTPDTILQDGDRVEIYRPLRFDPKVVRRTNAAEKQRRRRSSAD